MATLHSANGALGFIVEVTHGTDPTGTPTNFFPVAKISMDNPVVHVRPMTTLRNDGFVTSAPREGKNGPVTVSLSAPVTYDSIGIVWHAFVGSSGTSGAGDPYTHTYATTGTPELPSYTAEYIYDGTSTARRASGLRGDKLTLSCNAGEEWQIAAEYMGLTLATPASKSTITYGTTQLVPMWSDATIVWNSINLHLYATSVKVELTNDLKARDRFGSRTYAEVYSGRNRMLKATVEISLDSTLFDSFQAALEALTASDLVITITDPAVSNRSITLTVNDARVVASAIGEQSGGDMITLSLQFDSTATTSADALTLVVVNGISTAVGNG